MQNRRYFITGTDTGIGKTVVSAILMKQNPDYFYWKPVQSGLDEETDSECIQRIASIRSERIIPEVYRLQAPRSPHEAAALENTILEISSIRIPIGYNDKPLIIEGAGGLLVPLNMNYYIIDLINLLNAEVILVAKSGLGTLNHTLLSLEALKNRDIPIKGVILNGPTHISNRETIKNLGKVEILAEIDSVAEVTSAWIDNLKFGNLYL